MIDLHSHTTASDGSYSPRELLEEAARVGVAVLAITDHDTFAGYEEVACIAGCHSIKLIRGIELSTKLHGQSVHLLGYFFSDPRLRDLKGWIAELQRERHDRNTRLVARLRELGVEVTLAEAEARGKGMTGRSHFARILVEKGYVSTLQQAFDDYLDESAKAYVYRTEPQFAECAERIRDAGGIASLAHPIRIKEDLDSMMPELCAAGLNAIEVYHSDHDCAATNRYLRVAQHYGLLTTGGSDFHGTAKPGLQLGTGYGGRLRVPEEIMEQFY